MSRKRDHAQADSLRPPGGAEPTRAPSRVGRRHFLAATASLVALNSASLLLGRGRAGAGDSPTDPMLAPGMPARAYGDRSSFETASRSAAGSHSLTPLHSLHGIVTPSSLHFERHHNGVPAIDPSHHRLMVLGFAFGGY